MAIKMNKNRYIHYSACS